MDIYPLLKPLLFSLAPETAHNVAMKSLLLQSGLKKTDRLPPEVSPREFAGIHFRNPVGLAAGLDKNADYLDALGTLGFGFIEVGTVTPLAQDGNPKPRMFRLPESKAIINRLGFNNKGVEYLVEQVSKRRYAGVLGINIGKNKDTPEEKAIDDYLICMDAVYEYADYITANVSSPNTAGLRDLQHGQLLHDLVVALKKRQQELAEQHQKQVPVFIKVAPDLDDEQVAAMSDSFNSLGIDGLIATNTTLSREVVSGQQHAEEAGGLSGGAITTLANNRLALFREKLSTDIPIIGVGGIVSAEDAVHKLAHGAGLVQIYSGMIYRGPQLVKDILKQL